MNTLGRPMAWSLFNALGSSQIYATMTIDKSAKSIAEGRIGTFGAGTQSFDSSMSGC